MGLGPLNAIYQARFNRYLLQPPDRRHQPRPCVVLRRRRRDGRTRSHRQPCRLAAREQLDNLIFVVNCNLQRLDGPVRGNGKIIQEFEGIFRGAGWNVDQGDLGSRVGRPARPRRRRCARQQDEHDHSTASSRSTRSRAAPTSASTSSAPTRDCASSSTTCPTTTSSTCRRGGHDYRKLYSAYKLAVEHEGRTDGDSRQDRQGLDARSRLEARNATHQIKKIDVAELRAFRDRLELPITDSEFEAGEPPYYHPGPGQRRVRLPHAAPACPRTARCPTGSCAPRRVELPGRRTLRRPTRRHRREGAASTTTAFTRLLAQPAARPGARAGAWCRSSPTRPARSAWTPCSARSRSTSPLGQPYEPVDAALLLSYQRVTTTASSSRRASPRPARWRASPRRAPSYATWGEPMIPFFIFYSMFGFQRVGDLDLGASATSAAAASCSAPPRAGPRSPAKVSSTATARASCYATAVPNCRAYDPAFAYEMAVIVRDGIRRMYGARRRGLLLLPHALQRDLPDAAHARRRRGRDRPRPLPVPGRRHRRPATVPSILASGTAMLAALDAQTLLADEFDVAADVWSATSYNSLRDGRPRQPSAGTGSTRPSRRARLTSPSASPTPKVRSWPSPTS